MNITWTTTASLVLEHENTYIVFDPFCGIPRAVPPDRHFAGCGILEFRQFLPLYRNARHIFVTHGHFDHILHIPQIYPEGDSPLHFRRGKNNLSEEKASPLLGSVRIYATAAPCETLRRKGVPAHKLVKIAPGFQTEAGPFRIRTYASRHCVFDAGVILQTLTNTIKAEKCRGLRHLIRLLLLNFQYPERHETLFYEINCGGKRIQIMGSLNLLPGVSYPEGADLLVLPLQGRSDLTSYALRIVKRLRPKQILIDHFDNSFPPLSSKIDPREFVAEAAAQLRIPCIVPGHGQTIAI